MLRISSVLAAAVVSGLLAMGGSALAKSPGGGGGHGGHSGGHSAGHSAGHSSGHYSSGHGHSHNGHNHSGFFLGVYPGFGGYPYYRSDYGYSSYPSYRSYYYDPSPGVVVTPGAYEPAPRLVAPASSSTEVRILLPDAGAQVWIDGMKSSGTDATRIFGFPDEAPGQKYLHKVRVVVMRQGKPVAEEREVAVAGGASVVVDFRGSGDKAPLPPPKPQQESP